MLIAAILEIWVWRWRKGSVFLWLKKLKYVNEGFSFTSKNVWNLCRDNEGFCRERHLEVYVRPVHVLVLCLWEIELVVNVWERTREIFACNKLYSKSNKWLIWNWYETRVVLISSAKYSRGLFLSHTQNLSNFSLIIIHYHSLNQKQSSKFIIPSNKQVNLQYARIQARSKRLATRSAEGSARTSPSCWTDPPWTTTPSRWARLI